MVRYKSVTYSFKMDFRHLKDSGIHLRKRIVVNSLLSFYTLFQPPKTKEI